MQPTPEWVQTVAIGFAAAIVVVKFGKDMWGSAESERNGWRGRMMTLTESLTKLAERRENSEDDLRRLVEAQGQMLKEMGDVLSAYTQDGRAAMQKVDEVHAMTKEMYGRRKDDRG